jgi:hypothetical protein
VHTHNEIFMRAPLDACLAAASDVERWSDRLPHYRRVRFRRKDGPGAGLVEMAAWRGFGPLKYPVWWVSEMRTDAAAGIVRYEHVDGITTGMDVEWILEAQGEGTRVTIVHDWSGPGWPLIGSFAARRVIGPHFVHVVADRTLAGVRDAVETAVAF